jgi:hypothetical protein
MNTNRLLAAVLVLQVVTLAGQWGGKPAYINDARADLPPDPGAQRAAQTEALRSVDAKLDRLIGLMEGGRLKVEVTNFPKENGKK